MTAVADDWILATTNRGKLAEFALLFASAPVRLRALEPGAAVAEETGLTFVENALIKARHAARLAGRPAIAEDSGLCVAALGGAPGVRSARFAGPAATDRENIECLLAALESVPETRRDAAFHCVIVALRAPEDPVPVIASGCWQGRIALEPRGNRGFGYDPVFIDSELGLTAAELEPDVKSTLSHRGSAARKLRKSLGLG